MQSLKLPPPDNVKYIKHVKPEVYKVKCADGSKGFVNIEADAICVFAKAKAVNLCHFNQVWSVEQAAEYLCSQIDSQDGDSL
ncbi:hypothetical protein [Catenovulum sediminis]|uniref:hypothetical protein n=1 Tax=Catenovulum sediminis TaxID=1740262 RepID=UPI00117E74B6|nr:hypothetical protein [Catenovulum sediminis]